MNPIKHPLGVVVVGGLVVRMGCLDVFFLKKFETVKPWKEFGKKTNESLSLLPFTIKRKVA